MRVPKTLPKWVPTLFQYVAQNEGCTGTSAAMLKLIEKHWNQFVATYSDPPVTKGSRKKDPDSDLKKAVTNYKESLAGAKKSKAEKLVQKFKNQIKQLPQPLRQAMVEEYNGQTPQSNESEQPELNTDEDQEYDYDAEPKQCRENLEDIAWDEVEGQTDQLYECFKEEVDKVGLSPQSDLVGSVNQLYGITKRIIVTVAQ